VLFSLPPQERSAQVRTRARCLIDGAPTAAEFDLPTYQNDFQLQGRP
jgi:hypothetical protein